MKTDQEENSRESRKMQRRGMYRLALKMLFRDRVKKYLLLGAFSFSTLLITQQAGIFLGLMNWTVSTIDLLQVPIWVMHPKVEQVAEPKPMRDTDADRVRSIPGVAWAYPIHYNPVQIKLQSGDFKSAQLVGLDTTTFVGGPSQILEGNLQDIRLPNAVLIDQMARKKFSLKVGDSLEINDKEARIVAVFKGPPSFTGLPYVLTTFDRALSFSPPLRKMVSYVLAAPKAGSSNEEVARSIEQRTDLVAKTSPEFSWFTIDWYIKNTGIPVSFGTTVLLGLMVGMAVSGQTFYTFIVDNLKNLATLKVIGVSTGLLTRMMLLQCFVIGFLGYGIGMSFAALFGLMALKNSEPPFYMPLPMLLFSVGTTVATCGFTCYLGWRKLKTIEAGAVFRD